MSTVAVTAPTFVSSPRLTARIAGAFYLVTFLTGGAALVVRGRLGAAAGLTAGVSYVAVTLLFYGLFKPVSRRLSLLAAAVSLGGVATFLPRGLAPLLAFAGVGWLIFLSPPLAGRLYPYVLAPGLLGEGALTLWLLVKGVNAERWNEQARAAGQ